MERLLNDKTKRTVLTLLTVMVLVRILYICVGGETEYHRSGTIDLTDCEVYPCVHLTQTFVGQKDRLYNIGLVFTGVADDRTGNITVQISSQNSLVYQTNVALSSIENGEWKKIYINADLESGEVYMLHLNSSNDCVQVPNVIAVSKESAPPETLGLYRGGGIPE